MPLGKNLVSLNKLTFVIHKEPERAPNTRETGSSVYIYIFIYLYTHIYIYIHIYIFLCMILHGNDLMRILNHHVLERDW